MLRANMAEWKSNRNGRHGSGNDSEFIPPYADSTRANIPNLRKKRERLGHPPHARRERPKTSPEPMPSRFDAAGSDITGFTMVSPAKDEKRNTPPGRQILKLRILRWKNAFEAGGMNSHLYKKNVKVSQPHEAPG